MFAYWFLLLVRKLICLLPGGPVRFLGGLFGAAGCYLDRRHRRVALDNLRAAFPEMSESARRRLALRSFARLGLNLVETLRLPVFLQPGWERSFSVEGKEHLEKAFARGKGVLFVLAHFGNWEYLALVPRLLSFRGGAVAQKIKNPAIDGLVREMREAVGLELFSKREVAGQLADYLARNGAVAILADQRARQMAVEVDFFGRPAPTTAGPAVLALKTSAALIPVFIYPAKSGAYRVVFEPEIELPRRPPFRSAVLEITARFTAVFERRIRRDPELWFWVHRRWGK
jgi:Kdo2-lipid IVA lauroyltransferase/acyltransferase